MHIVSCCWDKYLIFYFYFFLNQRDFKLRFFLCFFSLSVSALLTSVLFPAGSGHGALPGLPLVANLRGDSREPQTSRQGLSKGLKPSSERQASLQQPWHSGP